MGLHRELGLCPGKSGACWLACQTEALSGDIPAGFMSSACLTDFMISLFFGFGNCTLLLVLWSVLLLVGWPPPATSVLHGREQLSRYCVEMKWTQVQGSFSALLRIAGLFFLVDYVI